MADAVSSLQKSLEEVGAKIFYEKQLTSSDVSGSGRVVIPKAIAERYFPNLDVPTGTSLEATDPRGNVHSLRFRFWINNSSRMYLLEGTGQLQQAYDMRMGDVMVFAQKDDGALVLAGRPSTKEDAARRSIIKKPLHPSAGATSHSGLGRGPSSAVKKHSERQVMDIHKAVKKRREKQYVTVGQQHYVLSHNGIPVGFDPLPDGVFRVVPSSFPLPTGISRITSGNWVATLSLEGESYQAVFSTYEDAVEATLAAGFVL